MTVPMSRDIYWDFRFLTWQILPCLRQTINPQQILGKWLIVWWIKIREILLILVATLCWQIFFLWCSLCPHSQLDLFLSSILSSSCFLHLLQSASIPFLNFLCSLCPFVSLSHQNGNLNFPIIWSFSVSVKSFHHTEKDSSPLTTLFTAYRSPLHNSNILFSEKCLVTPVSKSPSGLRINILEIPF